MPGLFGLRAERDAQSVEARERELFEQIGRLEVENRWLKKSSALSLEARRALMDVEAELSVRWQCQWLGLDRSGLYYEPAGPGALELALCHRRDEIYTARPFYRVRRMTEALRRAGELINPKRVRRLLRQMGLSAVYPKPRLSLPGAGAPAMPYLLRGLNIVRPHQVWAIDWTCGRLRGGFAYLMAMLDWFRRYVLAWELATSLETLHCWGVLEAALRVAGRAAEITNSDPGCQFTSAEWIAAVEAAGMQVSHDGRGRALDNVMVERLWRTVKYEGLYLRDYQDVPAARAGLGRYFEFDNTERLHQGLDYHTPWEVIKGPDETSREGTGNDFVPPVPCGSNGGAKQTRKHKSENGFHWSDKWGAPPPLPWKRTATAFASCSRWPTTRMGVTRTASGLDAALQIGPNHLAVGRRLLIARRRGASGTLIQHHLAHRRAGALRAWLAAVLEADAHLIAAQMR